MKINLGIVSVEETDFKRLEFLTDLFKNRRPISPNYQSDFFIAALKVLVNYMLSDRITEGLGQNGWAISDKKYMTDLYGERIIKDFNDSLMTSVVVSLAINTFYREFKKKKCLSNELEEYLERLISYSIIPYFKEHWIESLGAGGTFSLDRENNKRIVPTYRHSSWLLLIWLEFPIFYDRVEKSINYLLTDYERVNWLEEKVATDIAAYKAFNRIMQLDEFSRLISNSKIEVYLKDLENRITAKYVENIHGWTSGINKKRGRQIYTLFVLAELANYFEDKSKRFYENIHTAWDYSIDGDWNILRDGIEFDFQSGSPDLNLLSLGFSSLCRRTKLSIKDEEIFKTIYPLIMERLKSGEIGNPYSWALSYFLYDISMLVGDSK